MDGGGEGYEAGGENAWWVESILSCIGCVEIVSPIGEVRCGAAASVECRGRGWWS